MTPIMRLVLNIDQSIIPHNETETRRMRAYLMLVIEVLTFRASATALPPSEPSSLPPRLEKGTHNYNDPLRS